MDRAGSELKSSSSSPFFISLLWIHVAEQVTFLSITQGLPKQPLFLLASRYLKSQRGINYMIPSHSLPTNPFSFHTTGMGSSPPSSLSPLKLSHDNEGT